MQLFNMAVAAAGLGVGAAVLSNVASAPYSVGEYMSLFLAIKFPVHTRYLVHKPHPKGLFFFF